jgi:hypothetical protein
MSNDVHITYVNNSMNPDHPTIFVFAKNLAPTFDTLKDGVAWRVMPEIGKGSSSSFVFPVATTVQAAWGDGNKTAQLNAVIGKRYTVEEDNTGIVLIENGNASQSNAIEVSSLVQVEGGISAQICKDGKPLLTENIVAYDQKATFILHPKLYWGIASEIQEGQLISSAVLNTDDFFEQDIEGVTRTTVTLVGNPREGYNFVLNNID